MNGNKIIFSPKNILFEAVEQCVDIRGLGKHVIAYKIFIGDKYAYLSKENFDLLFEEKK